jgi:hypothetical protein
MLIPASFFMIDAPGRFKNSRPANNKRADDNADGYGFA